MNPSAPVTHASTTRAIGGNECARSESAKAGAAAAAAGASVSVSADDGDDDDGDDDGDDDNAVGKVGRSPKDDDDDDDEIVLRPGPVSSKKHRKRGTDALKTGESVLKSSRKK